MRKRKPDDRVTANDVIAFIERTCRVPEGHLVGQPLKLADFQVDFIKGVYDNPTGPTRRAILSTGRKNSKTTTCACLMLNHLCGPSARIRPNSQLYSAAQSRDQAALIFGAAVKMIRFNLDLASAVRVMETAKTLVCGELGTRYRALSADASTAFGLNPQFTIFDELGQVRGPRSSLFEALESATGALADPLSVIISTQAANDSDLLSLLIDDALAGHDQSTVIRLYTTPPDLDPFGEAAVRAANPGYDVFMNQIEVRGMAQAARRMPAREAQYRNLVLNQRIEVASPFIAPAVWKACGGEPLDLAGRNVFAGLDLSETADLTALVLAYCDPFDALWHIHPVFWLPEERLMEKAVSDRVPYDQWAAEGWLETTPGGSISYEFIAERLKDIFEEHRVTKIAFDRWNFPHLRPWLVKAGFPEAVIKESFVEWLWCK